MMDEAFMPFEEILRHLMTFGSGYTTAEEGGVRTYITAVEIETPVELDVTRDESGALRVGTTPPLYTMRTSFLPSFHRLSFKARLEELP